MSKRRRRGIPPGRSGSRPRKPAPRRSPRAARTAGSPAPQPPAVAEAARVRVELAAFFHPQRGGYLASDDFDRQVLRYRGGADSGWREIARVLVWATPRHGGSYVVEDVVSSPEQVLPDGYLWADPARQHYGMGGPDWFFGPRERACRRCGDRFVFTAGEQKYIYETLRLHIDVVTLRCPACRAVKRAQQDYAKRVTRMKQDPSPENHLEVARAAVRLRSLGGQVDLDKAIGYSRRAKRSPAHAATATRVEEQLVELRAEREPAGDGGARSRRGGVSAPAAPPDGGTRGAG